MATRPVVVGVDGSEESLRAVEWAAVEAGRRRSPLRIVSAPAIPPRMHAHAFPVTVASTLREISGRALGAAVTRAEEIAPGLLVDTDLLSGARPWRWLNAALARPCSWWAPAERAGSRP